MSLYFLGNCQTNALKAITKDVTSVPASGASITEYWGTYTPDESEAAMDQADAIIAMAVMNPEHRFAAHRLKARWGEKVIFHPYFYLDGLCSLERISSKGVGVVRGSAEIQAAQAWPHKVKLTDDFAHGRIDMRQQARLDYSLARMHEPEKAFDALPLTPYIRDTYREAPILYAINHPVQRVLFHLFDALAERLGLQVDSAARHHPLVWAKRALPLAQQSLTPQDVAVHGLKYDAGTHWWPQASRLIHSLTVAEAAARAAAKRSTEVDPGPPLVDQ